MEISGISLRNQHTYNFLRLYSPRKACFDMEWRVLFCRNLRTENKKFFTPEALLCKTLLTVYEFNTYMHVWNIKLNFFKEWKQFSPWLFSYATISIWCILCPPKKNLISCNISQRFGLCFCFFFLSFCIFRAYHLLFIFTYENVYSHLEMY